MEILKCPVCEKECKGNVGLKSHMRSHTKEEIDAATASPKLSKPPSVESTNTEVKDTPTQTARPRQEKLARDKRVPLGRQVTKLNVEGKNPNRVYRHVNDDGGRLQQAQSGGYRFESDDSLKMGEGEDPNVDIGSAICQRVGTKVDGTALMGYLMSIDKDWYNEDQAEKMAKIDELDKRIQRGENENTLGQHGYIPDDGISYTGG